MPSVHPTPLYSRAEIGIFPCAKCDKPMRLACIEPLSSSFDLRTFECTPCDIRQYFAVAI